jgi:FkbM family methyltransferase
MCRAAERVPRYQRGHLRAMGYDLEYVDLLSTCPQWHEIFVRRQLEFRAASGAPRILDCGANIGLASLYFKRLYPKARVTAFEADPTVASVLDGNLTRNHASDVERVVAAVWTTNGQVAFAAEGSDSGAITDGAAAVPSHRAGTGAAGAPAVEAPRITVPAVRLRDRLARERVDMLKLDIEGAELAVLRDCEDVLGSVAALQVEVHDLVPGKRLLPATLDLIERAGFVTSIESVLPVTWRPYDAAGTPFPSAPPIWLTTLRAWRPTRMDTDQCG